jgi:hypothetical protein
MVRGIIILVTAPLLGAAALGILVVLLAPPINPPTPPLDPRSDRRLVAVQWSDWHNCVGIALYNQPDDGKTDPAIIASAIAPRCAVYYDELVAQMKIAPSQIELITPLVQDHRARVRQLGDDRAASCSQQFRPEPAGC